MNKGRAIFKAVAIASAGGKLPCYWW
jgi:hypothetical protein